MKHTLHRPLNILALLLVAAVALTAFTAGPETVARAWPNFTESESHSIFHDGTLIQVTAFQRRKMYIPLNTLQREKIRKRVVASCTHKRYQPQAVERGVHLFYDMADVDSNYMNDCVGCDANALLAHILSKYGKPQQIATYDQGVIQHRVDILEPEDIRIFMNRFDAR